MRDLVDWGFIPQRDARAVGVARPDSIVLATKRCFVTLKCAIQVAKQALGNQNQNIPCQFHPDPF